MSRIYISGPISGRPDLNRPAFSAAAAGLRSMGHDVINPHDIPAERPGEWTSHMRADLAALVTCDLIAFLPGWQDSRGARLEATVAVELGLGVVFLPDVRGMQ